MSDDEHYLIIKGAHQKTMPFGVMNSGKDQLCLLIENQEYDHNNHDVGHTRFLCCATEGLNHSSAFIHFHSF